MDIRKSVLIGSMLALATSIFWSQRPSRAEQTRAVSHPSRGVVTAGKLIYIAQGCYQCHGHVGQGAQSTGPALVGLRLTDEALVHYVRSPGGVMPAFSAKLLPAAQIAPLVAYIRSLSAGRPASAIPLLAGYVGPVRTSQSGAKPGVLDAGTPGTTGEGGALFAQHCAGCHGAKLEGGIGPALTAEASTRNADQIAQFILAPPPPMPKLYPQPLNTAQVRAIANYVHAWR